MAKKEAKEIELNVDAQEEVLVKLEEERQEFANKLKTKHQAKKVFFIEVESEEEADKWLGAYFRKPNLKEFSYFTSLAERDKIGALQDLMKKIFLEGDSQIIEDDDYFLSAMTQIEDIVNVQASRIKKY